MTVTYGRGRVSKKARPRVSQREAAVVVAEALDLGAIARKLRQNGGDTTGRCLPCDLEPPTLDPAEGAAFDRALRTGGLFAAVERLGQAIAADSRTRRKLPGRVGAPARDWLRTQVRELLAAIRARKAAEPLKVAALLVLLFGFDRYAVFAKTEGAAPVGRARIRWLTKRLFDLSDDGKGQYAQRKKA